MHLNLGLSGDFLLTPRPSTDAASGKISGDTQFKRRTFTRIVWFEGRRGTFSASSKEEWPPDVRLWFQPAGCADESGSLSPWCLAGSPFATALLWSLSHFRCPPRVFVPAPNCGVFEASATKATPALVANPSGGRSACCRARQLHVACKGPGGALGLKPGVAHRKGLACSRNGRQWSNIFRVSQMSLSEASLHFPSTLKSKMSLYLIH